MLKATLQNVFGWSASAVALVVAMPIMTWGFGVESMGIYLLAAMISGYVGTLLNPVGEAAIRSLARRRERNDSDGFSRVFQVALTVQLFVMCILAVVLWLLSTQLVARVFVVPPEQQAEAIRVLRIVCFTLAVQGVFALLNSVFVACGDFFHFNLFQASASLLSMSAGSAIAVAGKSVSCFFVANGVIFLVLITVQFARVQRTTPGIRLRLCADRELLRELIGFGSWSSVSQVVGLVNFHLGRTVAAVMIGTATLPYFAIPNSLAAQLHGLFGRVALFVFPKVTADHEAKRISALRDDYKTWMRLYLVVVSFCASYLAMRAEGILTVWMGADFAARSEQVLVLLAFWVFWHSLATIPFYVANGVGKPIVNAGNTTVLAVLSGALMFLLAPSYGLVGIAGAMCLGSTAVVPVYTVLVQKMFLGVTIREALVEIIAPVIPVLALGVGWQYALSAVVPHAGMIGLLTDAVLALLGWGCLVLLFGLVPLAEGRSIWTRRRHESPRLSNKE